MKKMIQSTKKTLKALNENKLQTAFFLCFMFLPVIKGYAVTDYWKNAVDFITPWVTKLGGAIAFIGAIEFGMGWKADDADAKTKGIRFIVSGCMVAAAGAAGDKFLA